MSRVNEDILSRDSSERRIRDSKVREFFTPGKPVSTYHLLFGRADALESALSSIATPGLHPIVYGERGIGKSSLAQIVGLLIPTALGAKNIRKVEFIRCDEETTFAAIAKRILVCQGKSSKPQPDDTDSLNPAELAPQIANDPMLIIIDEVDAIRGDETIKKLGRLIKLLSDANSKLKLMIVGIAESAEALLRGHLSSSRNLTEVHVRLLKDSDIKDLLVRNAAECSLKIEDFVLEEIAELAGGFPYFAQLIGLYCAEQAVRLGKSVIGEDEFKRGLTKAKDSAENHLRFTYENTVRAGQSEHYKSLIQAAASLDSHGFTSTEWVERCRRIERNPSLSRSALQPYIKSLVGDDRSIAIRRVRKGRYRFNDPRLRIYARIRLREEQQNG